MKSFKTFIIEQILRRPDKETMDALSNSGAFISKSGEPLRFKVYHGGHFGEAEGETPHRDMISFPETSNRWRSTKFSPEIAVTPSQAQTSGMGLSTTPDAIAARQYRLHQFSGIEDHTSDRFNSPVLGKLYELDISVRPERFKTFRDFGHMEEFILSQTNSRQNPHYGKWLEDNKDSLKDFIDDGKRRKYLTDVVGVDALGVHSGSSGVARPGEILILNKNIIGDISDKTREVDRVRERMSKARKYANIPGNIPVVDSMKQLNRDRDEMILRQKNSMGGPSFWKERGWTEEEAEKVRWGEDPFTTRVRNHPLSSTLDYLISKRWDGRTDRSNRPEFRKRS